MFFLIEDYIIGLGEISQADLNFKIKTRTIGIFELMMIG